MAVARMIDKVHKSDQHRFDVQSMLVERKSMKRQRNPNPISKEVPTSATRGESQSQGFK